jgi:glycosyltransferase involved in cell wall biosynthesis
MRLLQILPRVPHSSSPETANSAPPLEQLAKQLAPGQVHFTGFKNQTELPAFYDLSVIPSLLEPWGLVVNEVMNAGKPVLASDPVGAAAALIEEGVNGEVFPAGDTHRLAELMRDWLSDPASLRVAGQPSLARINQWGFEENLEGLLAALKHLKQGAD